MSRNGKSAATSPRRVPGARIPHMWLSDGSALQDRLGDNYTLLDLRGESDGGDCDASALVAAFRERGAPIEVLHLDEKRVREVYGASVFLLRPDLHIVWRGNGPPDDPAGLAALATGWGPSRPVHQPRIQLAR